MGRPMIDLSKLFALVEALDDAALVAKPRA